MTMPTTTTTTNTNTSNPAPEAKTETPPAPEAKPVPVPARPRVAFSSLSPAERLHVCRIAANQSVGGKLPLEVREAILADYEGIPSGAFAPDPVGPGWAERLAEGAQVALMAIVGVAAGAMGLLLLVETSKAILRSMGALPTATTPPVLPPAPDSVGDEMKAQ